MYVAVYYVQSSVHCRMACTSFVCEVLFRISGLVCREELLPSALAALAIHLEAVALMMFGATLAENS